MAPPNKPNELSTLPVLPHSISLNERHILLASGVQRILSCDDTGALLQTPLGNLAVGGQEIQVSELSVKTGEVKIVGKIEYLQYTENKESTGGVLHRLFH